MVLDKMDVGFEVDEILPFVGEFGLYQIILETVVCLSGAVGIYQIFLPYFVAYSPPWRCVANSSVCKLNNSVALGDNDYKLRCKIPRQDWEYTQDKQYSIVTEFDLSCSRETLMYIHTSLFFVSWAIGSILLGWWADKRGRRRVIFTSALVILLTSLISAFSPAYWFYALTRAIVGFFSPGYLVMPFIYVSEIVGPKYRPLSGITLFVVGSLAIAAVGLHAYFIREWRTLKIVCSAPYLPTCILYYFMPESIRWQRLNGRSAEAMETLKNIAKWNKKQIKDDIRLKEIDNDRHDSIAVSPLDIFRPNPMLIKSMALGFAWLTNSMVYYGIALAADKLGGNMYRDYTLSALVGLIGDFVAIIVSTRFGRKKMVLIPMFISALACIAVSIIPYGETNELNILRLVIGMIGKLCIQISFDVIYTWSVELYPTIIRSEGIGWLQVTSRIGGAFAPWVSTWLTVYHVTLPFSLMGGTCFVSALFLLHLPETKDQATAETLDDNKNNLKNDIELAPHDA